MPEIEREKARAILDLCAEQLKAKLGWTEASGTSNGDGAGEGAAPHVPQKERLKQTKYQGDFGVNQALLEIPMMLLDDCMPMADVVKACLEKTRCAWEELPDDHPKKDVWDWNEDKKQIVDFVVRTH